MYSELSSLYSSYIKFLLNFKVKSKLLNCRISEVSAKIKNLSSSELFVTYEQFDAMVT